MRAALIAKLRECAHLAYVEASITSDLTHKARVTALGDTLTAQANSLSREVVRGDAVVTCNS